MHADATAWHAMITGTMHGDKQGQLCMSMTLCSACCACMCVHTDKNV